jgi:hypothetical protein
MGCSIFLEHLRRFFKALEKVIKCPGIRPIYENLRNLKIPRRLGLKNNPECKNVIYLICTKY